VRYLANVVQGDFGKSYYSGFSVGEELKLRIPVSMELGMLAMAISVIVGIPIGVIAALRQDSWADYLSRGGVILFLAMPAFWTAIIVLQVGRIYFQWAPPARYEDLWVNPVQNLYIMATPALILGINLAAIQARFARAQMLEVLRQDYIRTAWAKGLTGRTVVVRHALRNALIPVVTVIGLQLAGAVTGTIILEQIFLIPGVGRYLIFAATNADYPIVQAVTLLLAVVVIFVNLFIDVSYAFLDPRVRESYA
jgi:peptide/nickel transport system permease protein